MYDFPFPSAEMLKRIPPVTTAHTNGSVDYSKRIVGMLERYEHNLQVAMVSPKQGSAAQAFAIQGRPSSEAMHYEKSSMIITKASQNIMWRKCTK